jgi:anaerobic selenocysteine-containing dehydrogenase/Fe-S-cluster-containing dehydrogenase component
MDDMSRRRFLQAAATTGAAWAAESGSRAVNKLIPYVNPPTETRPGTWIELATTCRECPAGCGMHLWHRDGRVTKAEGNPASPVSGGGLCPRGQASLQGLYDPDRVRHPLARREDGTFAPTDWETALSRIGKALAEPKARAIVVSDLQTGAAAEVLRAFADAWGPGVLAFHEPFDYAPLRAAHGAVFGMPVIPQYRLEKCDFILSLAADFLETWVSPVEFARGFAASHAYRDGTRGRFAYVGPRLSMTAANADEFLAVEPGDESWMGLAVLRAIIENGWAQQDVSALGGIGDAAGRLPAEVVRRVAPIARAFVQAKAGVALGGAVGMGGEGARRAALVAALLNWAAGRVGTTVDFARPHALSALTDNARLRGMLRDMRGEDVLFVCGANPAYSLPDAASDLRRAALIVSLSPMLDETASMADWVLPVDTPLESWGDYEPYAGLHGTMQPTMARLFDTRPACDVLLALARAGSRPLSRPGADRPADDFREWLQQRWKEVHARTGGSLSFDEFWREAVRTGGAREEPETRHVGLSPQVGALDLSGDAAASEPAGGKVRLWLWPSIMLFDGRVANRGWLQEAPDPMSTVVWGSWVDVHPDRAKALGIRDGDVVEIQANGGTVEAPARITRDVAPGTAALAFGQGHTALGGNAAGRGANAFALASPPQNGTDRGTARLRPTGQRARLLYLSATQQQFGREIVQWVPLATARGMKPGQGDELVMPLPEGYRRDRDLYRPHEYKEHRWAMVADLDRCIGCGACAVACYAENNLPVMGAAQMAKGREMAWLKVVPYRDDARPERVGWLPLMCQQCDAAPCEPVCPVFASVHNDEGLNAQVYNRCVGTRYCSNNCPYKVRRFNWLNVKWREPLDLQLNPDVSVRCRGVMEKCSFCIQRIRGAEHAARREGRSVRDGEIQPACVQSCPTQALVFGDLMDPAARVTQLTRLDPRRYHVLEELNTKPAVTYLRRVAADEEA